MISRGPREADVGRIVCEGEISQRKAVPQEGLWWFNTVQRQVHPEGAVSPTVLHPRPNGTVVRQGKGNRHGQHGGEGPIEVDRNVVVVGVPKQRARVGHVEFHREAIPESLIVHPGTRLASGIQGVSSLRPKMMRQSHKRGAKVSLRQR